MDPNQIAAASIRQQQHQFQQSQAQGQQQQAPPQHQLTSQQFAQMQMYQQHARQMAAAANGLPPNMASLPPNMQAQAAAAAAAAGGYRQSPGEPSNMKPPPPMQGQQQMNLPPSLAYMQEEALKRNIQLGPAQLQALMQAQAAQAQAQAQAAQLQHLHQQQQQPALRQSASASPAVHAPQPGPFNLSNPNGPPLPNIPNNGPTLRQNMQNQQHLLQQSQRQQVPPSQFQQQQQQQRPHIPPNNSMQGGMNIDPSSANAVAGPSNVRHSVNTPPSLQALQAQQQNQPPQLNQLQTQALFQSQNQTMSPRPTSSHKSPTKPAKRRPSMDQVQLMQRLSNFAAKGGLPIDSIFTKTSWIPASSSQPLPGQQKPSDSDEPGELANEPSEDNEDRQDKPRGEEETRPDDERDPFPTFTEREARDVQAWMKKDLRNMDLSNRERARMKEVLEDLAREVLVEQDWLGPPRHPNDNSKGMFKLRTRKEMNKDLAKGKRKSRPWLSLSKSELRSLAREEECLIPIRLDIEHDGRKFNDTFTWNVHEKLITPQTFATILCEDLLLEPEHFHSLIVQSIMEQIKQYQEAEESHPRTLFIGHQGQSALPTGPTSGTEGQEGDQAAPSNTNGTTSATIHDQLDPSHMDLTAEHDVEEDWWDGWRKKVKLAQDVGVGEEIGDVGFSALGADEMALDEGSHPPNAAHDELRILVQLDVSVEAINLRDQFEWDLADPQNSPEAFADIYCSDLGLPGEFKTAISHLIREQLDAYARSLSSIRHIRGDQILHDELRPAFQGPLIEPIRSFDVESWTPHLEKLGLAELDHREKERERQSRRQKRGARNNRRNVVALPDREPLRTNRTLMPKPGVKLDDIDQDGIEENVVPTYEIAQPYPLVPVKDLGPPPQMTSPLRKVPRIRQDMPLVAGVNGDAALAQAAKPKPTGRRRGRPPLHENRNKHLDNAYAADVSALSQSSQTPGPNDLEMSTPPPSTLPPSGVASPAPSIMAVPAMPVKKGVGRPAKNKNGWVKTEGIIHPNIIDGKWHCTNCGVPEPIAVGRRKGPAGSNTQCAECGKYWMSNKGRLRPCDYTIDPAFHLARSQGFHPQVSFSAGPTDSGATTPAAAPPDSPGGSVFEPDSGDDYKPGKDDDSRHRRGSEESSPIDIRKKPVSLGKGKGKGKEGGAGKGMLYGMPPPPSSLNPQASFMSSQTASAGSPPAASQPRATPVPQSPLPTIKLSPPRPGQASPPRDRNPRPARGPTPHARVKLTPPSWMSDAVAALQAERPHDRFEVIHKPRQDPNDPNEAVEWRLKCLDCPGKVYKTGPEQTLGNFSAHLRFKGHRSAVAARMANQT